jgi:SAM-dependent methyltransferase
MFRANHPQFEHFAQLFDSDREAYARTHFDWQASRGDATVNDLRPYIRDLRVADVLDFGCSSGGLTWALGERCHRAIGIDIDAERVSFGQREIARRGKGAADIRLYNGRRIPMDDATVDVVLCIDVMEHLADPPGVIDEFVRVLKPGGILRIAFGPPWFHAHGKHLWTKLPGWWTHLLFPARVAMLTAGLKKASRWEDIGLNKMSVARFNRLMRHPLLMNLDYYEGCRAVLRPLRSLPFVRELVIGDVGGVWKRQDEPSMVGLPRPDPD